ncbi:DUF3048 domain-containing protein [Candidatus Saccharibacteria bacterium]|nr:DUF3048 domain-containing protein [Candidatus Saccharibacteria bacterium]
MKLRKKNSFRNWIAKNKILVMIVIGTLLLIGGGVTAWLITGNDSGLWEIISREREEEEEEEPEPIVWHAALTGRVVETEAEVNSVVTAIAIENSPQARPQSGLKEAGVVFESVAEGGITRFLAFYQDDKPAMIGPVRSLRTCYLDWVAGFDAVILHYGGSAAALNRVRNGPYRRLDEMVQPRTTWRSADRWAPHNVYTNFERIDGTNRDLGWEGSNFVGWERKDAEVAEELNATHVDFRISHGHLYNSTFNWNGDYGVYFRSQGGAPHMDREQGHIAPNVVIAIIVDQRTVMEDGWRTLIGTTGAGYAYVFQDGTVTPARWRKQNREAMIEFFDREGVVVPLNRGQVWITALPSDERRVTWQ